MALILHFGFSPVRYPMRQSGGKDRGRESLNTFAKLILISILSRAIPDKVAAVWKTMLF
jgi:hypothetical protein